MSTTRRWTGKIEVIASHASTPGYRSIQWRRSDNYSEPGMQPAPMWLPESFDVQVGDEITVTIELTAALARIGGAK